MERVILVVADPGDLGARTAGRDAAGLAGPGTTAYVVSVRELHASTWQHEVDRSGRASTWLRLPGGRTLHDTDLAAVLFREMVVSTSAAGPAAGHAAGPEAAYATAEWTALLVSWLSGLGDRVVNAVAGDSLVGPAWGQHRWLLTAAVAGLPVALRGHAGPGLGEHTVLVVGDTVLGEHRPVDADVAAALLRVAEHSGCRLLEARFDQDGFVAALSAVPALRDPEQAHATARLLARLAGARRAVAA